MKEGSWVIHEGRLKRVLRFKTVLNGDGSIEGYILYLHTGEDCNSKDAELLGSQSVITVETNQYGFTSQLKYNSDSELVLFFGNVRLIEFAGLACRSEKTTLDE